MPGRAFGGFGSLSVAPLKMSKVALAKISSVPKMTPRRFATRQEANPSATEIVLGSGHSIGEEPRVRARGVYMKGWVKTTARIRQLDRNDDATRRVAPATGRDQPLWNELCSSAFPFPQAEMRAILMVIADVF